MSADQKLITFSVADFIRRRSENVHFHTSKFAGEDYYMFRILITVVVATLSITTITHAETGPCQEKKLKQKVACLNKRLGDLERLVKTLPTKKDLVDSAASSTTAATSAVIGTLRNVRIEWADHPGVCLFFNDWTKKPERTAYTVEGCDNQPGFLLSIVPR